LIDGIPLFLKDHLDRMNSSAQVAGLPAMPSVNIISAWIETVVALNLIEAMNLRLEWVLPASGEAVFFVFFVPAKYPTSEMYQNGVSVQLFKWVRESPEAKIWRSDYKAKVAQLLAEAGAYELLLVDDQECITEGSRSNVFWVQKDVIITAPDQMVLGGITRKYVLESCRQLDLRVEMVALPVAEINNCAACFLCGTSPKVLPVGQVGNVLLASAENALVQKIMVAFDQKIAGWIDAHPRPKDSMSP